MKHGKQENHSKMTIKTALLFMVLSQKQPAGVANQAEGGNKSPSQENSSNRFVGPKLDLSLRFKSNKEPKDFEVSRTSICIFYKAF